MPKNIENSFSRALQEKIEQPHINPETKTLFSRAPKNDSVAVPFEREQDPSFPPAYTRPSYVEQNV